MATLYELTANYTQLYMMLCDPDADEESIRSYMDSISGEIEEKADGYAKIARGIEADIAALKGEEARLKARRQSLENNLKRLKGNLEYAMALTGKTKFKTELFSFNIQKNAPSVKVEDEAKFIEFLASNNRDDLLKHEAPKLNKTAIKDAIMKDGEVFDGVEVVQTESLRIR